MATKCLFQAKKSRESEKMIKNTPFYMNKMNVFVVSMYIDSVELYGVILHLSC